MKKILITFTIYALMFICILSGCSGETNDQQTVLYNMDYAQSSQQYCLFMTKQISAVTNQLSSNINIAHLVTSGDYVQTDAIENAEYSLGIIKAAKSEVEIMAPPEKYNDTRAHTLKLFSNAENDLQTYIEELQKEHIDVNAIEKLVSIMQTDFSALTSEFNIYYE